MDRLSGKEIGAIRKLMMEKKQEERKCNIFFAIKGGKEDVAKGKVWAQKFIKEKTGVDVKVIR